jgi:hypothetical protein
MTTNVQTLRDLRTAGRVPERDQSFVDSLLQADARRGLSLKQAEWVDKIVTRITNPPPVQTPLALESMVGVVQLLAKARERGLKFPKLWLQLPDTTPLRITIAGEQSKTPGYLVLTDGEKFGSNRYFGRISPAGELTIGRDGETIRSQLVELISQLAKDPAGVAAAFGHLTGHCCFCSLALKDERSTFVGYGRICAGKFGLPWGAKEDIYDNSTTP